jgi:hypothetical protein
MKSSLSFVVDGYVQSTVDYSGATAHTLGMIYLSAKPFPFYYFTEFKLGPMGF